MFASSRLGRWLDGRLYRAPFTGASARRYATHERPAFGDLDERLAARWRADLIDARVVLDVGAGPGTVGRALRAACPGACIVDVEPSRDFAAPRPHPRARRGEVAAAVQIGRAHV